MDKAENRDDYIDDLWKIVKLVKMTDRFRSGLDRHKVFGKYMKSVEKVRNPDQIKMFVLLELTRDKEWCNEVIRLLEECQQNEAALKLRTFNQSLTATKVYDQVLLDVKRVSVPQPRHKNSIIGLSKSSRGKCLIINFLEEPMASNVRDRYGQDIPVFGLINQTNQFAHVFTQLHFDVRVINDLNANQLKDKLKKLSEDKSLEESEAFVLIVISHCKDEAIVCADGSRVLRDINLDQKIKNGLESMKNLSNDVLPIDELMAIFSDNNCLSLKSKPKIFIFDCCHLPEHQESKVQRTIKIKNFIQWPLISDTIAWFSSAFGYSCYYDRFTGLTHYGQALCRSLALNACDEPLDSIMSKVIDNLERNGEEAVRKDPNTLRNRYVTEVTKYCTLGQKIYFNPGHLEQ